MHRGRIRRAFPRRRFADRYVRRGVGASAASRCRAEPATLAAGAGVASRRSATRFSTDRALGASALRAARIRSAPRRRSIYSPSRKHVVADFLDCTGAQHAPGQRSDQGPSAAGSVAQPPPRGSCAPANLSEGYSLRVVPSASRYGGRSTLRTPYGMRLGVRGNSTTGFGAVPRRACLLEGAAPPRSLRAHACMRTIAAATVATCQEAARPIARPRREASACARLGCAGGVSCCSRGSRWRRGSNAGRGRRAHRGIVAWCAQCAAASAGRSTPTYSCRTNGVAAARQHGGVSRRANEAPAADAASRRGITTSCVPRRVVAREPPGVCARLRAIEWRRTCTRRGTVFAEATRAAATAPGGGAQNARLDEHAARLRPFACEKSSARCGGAPPRPRRRRGGSARGRAVAADERRGPRQAEGPPPEEGARRPTGAEGGGQPDRRRVRASAAAVARVAFSFGADGGARRHAGRGAR